mmetsp:Transcript_67017/g.185163  ORF Transcript_67017/g.185163 Transcript_67017/m.185163 type:complete len:371 (+) Transcript_67017:486-1598(+)
MQQQQQQKWFEMQGARAPSSQHDVSVHGHGLPPSSSSSPYAGSPAARQATPPSVPVPVTTGPTFASRRPECQENFAEEECLEGQECGSDTTEPKAEHLILGFDARPLLPLGLALSLMLGGACTLFFEVPLMSKLTGWSEAHWLVALSPVYVITVGCMAYAGCCDPGQLRADASSQGQALMSADNLSSETNSEPPLPKRAHKSWQYQRPIRRYDHYCRWLTNVIGLLNHREFFVMLVGLIVIAILGIGMDSMLMFMMVHKSVRVREVVIVLHLIYSVVLLVLAGPILKIHVGLVSRNELASEWRRNDYYIAVKCKRGKNIPVNELSDDEFNDLFEHFKYDKKRNSWDRGCLKNCFIFWWTSRWHPDQLGEF